MAKNERHASIYLVIPLWTFIQSINGPIVANDLLYRLIRVHDFVLFIPYTVVPETAHCAVFMRAIYSFVWPEKLFFCFDFERHAVNSLAKMNDTRKVFV